MYSRYPSPKVKRTKWIIIVDFSSTNEIVSIDFCEHFEMVSLLLWLYSIGFSSSEKEKWLRQQMVRRRWRREKRCFKRTAHPSRARWRAHQCQCELDGREEWVSGCVWVRIHPDNREHHRIPLSVHDVLAKVCVLVCVCARVSIVHCKMIKSFPLNQNTNASTSKDKALLLRQQFHYRNHIRYCSTHVIHRWVAPYSRCLRLCEPPEERQRE